MCVTEIGKKGLSYKHWWSRGRTNSYFRTHSWPNIYHSCLYPRVRPSLRNTKYFTKRFAYRSYRIYGCVRIEASVTNQEEDKFLHKCHLSTVTCINYFISYVVKIAFILKHLEARRKNTFVTLDS